MDQQLFLYVCVCTYKKGVGAEEVNKEDEGASVLKGINIDSDDDLTDMDEDEDAE